jgi:hypothetical protein
VLQRLGLPYIDGYKPRGHVQAALETAVRQFLNANPALEDPLAGALDKPLLEPQDGMQFQIADIAEPAPVTGPQDGTKPAPSLQPAGKKTNWAQVDADNRKLGEQGEKFVLDLEFRRLTDIGRPDLAAAVEWTSRDKGDGFGYDIRSFDDAGQNVFHRG